MSQEMAGKRIAILAEELYEDIELWYPYYRLLEAGAEVKIIGSGRAESFMSKHGYPVVPDLSIDDTSAADFDGVVIPGGYSPDLMRRKPAMVAFVRDMDTGRQAGRRHLPCRVDADLRGDRQGTTRHLLLLDQGRHVGGWRSIHRRRSRSGR